MNVRILELKQCYATGCALEMSMLHTSLKLDFFFKFVDMRLFVVIRKIEHRLAI